VPAFLLLVLGLACRLFSFRYPNLALLIASLVTFVAGSWFGVWVFLRAYNGPTEVEITREALKWRIRGVESEIAWCHVSGFYLSQVPEKGSSRQWLRVACEQGPDVTLTSAFDGYDQLAETLEAITALAVLNQKRADLRRSGAAFGPLTLQLSGLRIRLHPTDKNTTDTFVRWHELKSVDVHRDALVIFPDPPPNPKHEFVVVPLCSVPNYRVLLQMIDETRRYIQAGGTAPEFA
jgi:hypothetical protein